MSNTSRINSIKSQVEGAIHVAEDIKSSLVDLRGKPEYASLYEYFRRAEDNMDHVSDNLREAGNELMWIENAIYEM